MRWQSLIRAGALALLLGGVAVRGAEPEPDSALVSPLYGVALPEVYRSWELIAPATEDAPFDELRVILANPIAAEAFRSGVRPFPDGSKLIKLGWKRQRSPDFASATVPGEATTIQVMVKDSRRYGASGGWGFGRFIAGKPVDEAQHRTCFACHDARVRDRDWVFTRLAP